MDSVFIARRGDENTYKILVGKLKGRGNSKYQVIEERITLK
jgi:hypothetical protein